MGRRGKAGPSKPLASLLPTEPAKVIAMPSPSQLLISTQQPKAQTPDPQLVEQELQSLRSGTHPGYLRALDTLDAAQNDHILAVHRLREERLRNVEEMFVAEMQGVEDEYKENAEELREKMIDELQSKTDPKGTKASDMVTRKRSKLSGKEEKPKKKANIKGGMRYCLSAEEISHDLEAVRGELAGLAGGTRSKSK